MLPGAMPEEGVLMGILHCQVSFTHRLHSWAIDYYAHGREELQDEWRSKMDPLGNIGQGVRYQIEVIR
jgi:hypothetical protein